VSGSGKDIGKRLDFGPCFCRVVFDSIGFDGKDPVSHGWREELEPELFEGLAIEIRALDIRSVNGIDEHLKTKRLHSK